MSYEENIRSYEVSIWTLQDSFITVLKPSDIEVKGQTEDGRAILKTDGTEEFNFRIPQYLKDTDIENIAWKYFHDNTDLIEGMKKIKVVFNKATKDEKVYEFSIIKVTELHEDDSIYYDVECEGLAFSELSKRGYKIVLNQDTYENDPKVIAWYNNEDDAQSKYPEPIENIQYWLNQFLEPFPQSDKYIYPNKWYYELRMDWSEYSIPGAESNKIYDEKYPIWGVDRTQDPPVPQVMSIEPAREKSRPVDLDESNIYNITQKLAEIFGVFCRYEYGHDQNYHIIYRKIIFYNNFTAESMGFTDLTYPYSASQIKRIIDSSDVTTKLFVKSVEDSSLASGIVTIMDSDANDTKEDYILNFDYLREINTISDEQMEIIKKFKKDVLIKNNEIIPVQEELNTYKNELPELKAQQTTIQNAIQLDKERISTANDLLNSLTNGTGEVVISDVAPASGVLLKDSSKGEHYYYLRISEKGVRPDTFKIFHTYTYPTETVEVNQEAPSRLSDELSWTPEYDEFGNFVRANNIYLANDTVKKTVYLTYNYQPSLYYDNVSKTWTARLTKDEGDLGIINNKISVLQSNIDQKKEQLENLLNGKKALLKNFEEQLGPAIREGYWQPENYTNYGNRYTDSIALDTSPLSQKSRNGSTKGEIPGLTPYADFIWDENKRFVNEQEVSYKIGATENLQYYPCIKLTSNMVDKIRDKIDSISFVYWESDNHDNTKIRILPIHSQCELIFLNTTPTDNNVQIDPALILLGDKERLNSNQYMQKNGIITEITTAAEDGQIVIKENEEVTIAITENQWINWSSQNKPKIAYPRIRINSLAFKNTPDEKSFCYNGVKLEEYEDYSVMSNKTLETEKDAFYITFKPCSLLRQKNDGVFNFFYTLSNASTAIYLDALQVSQENAYPKVSYELETNIFSQDFMRVAYNKLGTLIHINDSSLKLENARGYISQIELNLDQPWEDRIEVKNYKNKFEDLFSTIVAQTEAMQAAEPVLSSASQVLTLDGRLSTEKVQDVIRHVDLNYAFNNGNLTIDQANGIWGTSDSGVVAFRGGGIFTATEKTEDGNWKWNTGITPEGINANIITTGRLDTNLINIYAGDNIRLQINKDGLFAYKSYLHGTMEPDSKGNYTIDQYESLSSNGRDRLQTYINTEGPVDKKTYVKVCEDGLFLIAENGAAILEKEKEPSKYGITTTKKTVRRVEISWDGLKLRDWNNNLVFYADPDTGNLNITGRITATSGTIGGWQIDTDKLVSRGIELNSGENGGIKLINSDKNFYKIWYNGKIYAQYQGYEKTKEIKGLYYYYHNDDENYIDLDINKMKAEASVGNIVGINWTIISVQLKDECKYEKSLKYNIEVDDPSDPSKKIIVEQKKTLQFIRYPVIENGTLKNYKLVKINPSSIEPEELDDKDWEKIYLVYDQSNSLESEWYKQLNNLTTDSGLADLNPGLTNEIVEQKMVDKNYKPTYEQKEVSDIETDEQIYSLIKCKLDNTVTTTFSVDSKDGYITANTGRLGDFYLSQSGLSNGTLSNVSVRYSDPYGSEKTILLDSFARAFVDITANSAYGTYTLTRADGTSATFDITTMQKYQSDMVVQYQTGYSVGYNAGKSAGQGSAASKFYFSRGGITSGQTLASGMQYTVSAGISGTSAYGSVTFKTASSGEKTGILKITRKSGKVETVTSARFIASFSDIARIVFTP